MAIAKRRKVGSNFPGPATRVGSKRTSGSWDTQKWLIGKKLASVVKRKLIADTIKAADHQTPRTSHERKAVQSKLGRKTSRSREVNKPRARQRNKR